MKSARAAVFCRSDCPDTFEEDPKDGWSRSAAQASESAVTLRRGVTGAGTASDLLAQAAGDGCPVSVIDVE